MKGFNLLVKIIYWFLWPFRNSYKNKLRALLEGLETQKIDELMKMGKTGDFRRYGELYVEAVYKKIKVYNRR